MIIWSRCGLCRARQALDQDQKFTVGETVASYLTTSRCDLLSILSFAAVVLVYEPGRGWCLYHLRLPAGERTRFIPSFNDAH